uniref:Uncharacterized protein n=1 Tax=Vitis vinifera TaxID=29760 RepID=A5BL22_VITVI|nr:hypothetical protein VITISV_043803 [Vitis vinifera]
MGWEIVWQESLKYPGKHSRLWIHEDVSDALTRNIMYQQLKFVKLSYSQHLIETPDFSGAPNLRRLILEGCTSLSKVHPSTGDLNKLVFLNLEGCENLKSFLRSICMESLQNSYSLRVLETQEVSRGPRVHETFIRAFLGGHCSKRIALVD